MEADTWRLRQKTRKSEMPARASIQNSAMTEACRGVLILNHQKGGKTIFFCM
ncbi:MAG: hypothetical protein ACP5UA_07565 [Candidatus Hydrogenedens sp.]